MRKPSSTAVKDSGTIVEKSGHKVRFTGVIIDPYDEPFLDEKGKPFTYAAVAERSLNAPFIDESKLEMTNKTERFILAMKIVGAGKKPIVLTAHENVVLLACTEKMFSSPLVVGRMKQLIDPASIELPKYSDETDDDGAE